MGKSHTGPIRMPYTDGIRMPLRDKNLDFKYVIIMSYVHVLAQGIFVNIWPNLELREGRRIFSPCCSIRSLVPPRKSLMFKSLGRGVFLSNALFYPEKYSNIRKNVHL